jgi:hypothetical protein
MHDEDDITRFNRRFLADIACDYWNNWDSPPEDPRERRFALIVDFWSDLSTGDGFRQFRTRTDRTRSIYYALVLMGFPALAGLLEVVLRPRGADTVARLRAADEDFRSLEPLLMRRLVKYGEEFHHEPQFTPDFLGADSSGD